MNWTQRDEKLRLIFLPNAGQFWLHFFYFFPQSINISIILLFIGIAFCPQFFYFICKDCENLSEFCAPTATRYFPKNFINIIGHIANKLDNPLRAHNSLLICAGVGEDGEGFALFAWLCHHNSCTLVFITNDYMLVKFC